MDDLEQLAIEFWEEWESCQVRQGTLAASGFEKSKICAKLMELGFLQRNHLANPRLGEYVIQYKYAGPALVLANGELVFPESGLVFAKKVCDVHRKRSGSGIHIMKIVY